MAVADANLTSAMAVDEIDWFQLIDVVSRCILLTHLLYCLTVWLSSSGQSGGRLPDDIPEVLRSLDGLFGELLTEIDDASLTDEDSMALRRMLTSFRVELRLVKMAVTERRHSGQGPHDDELRQRQRHHQASAAPSTAGASPTQSTERLTAINTYMNRMSPASARKQEESQNSATGGQSTSNDAKKKDTAKSQRH